MVHSSWSIDYKSYKQYGASGSIWLVKIEFYIGGNVKKSIRWQKWRMNVTWDGVVSQRYHGKKKRG